MALRRALFFLTLIFMSVKFALLKKCCLPTHFPCDDGQCIKREKWCDGISDCDGSDEAYCKENKWYDLDPNKCDQHNLYWKCPQTGVCLPIVARCDGFPDCKNEEDEFDCQYDYLEETAKCATTADFIPTFQKHDLVEVNKTKQFFTKWFLGRKMQDRKVDIYGDQLHRIITALYFFSDIFTLHKSSTGNEMRYELIIQVLSHLYSAKSEEPSSNEELALYVQAMLVTCLDPSHFFGRDLVADLRERVSSSSWKNPFELLVLCTAGAPMTQSDLENLAKFYNAHHRPFWIENQAMAVMAVACMESRSDVIIRKETLENATMELKNHQFPNGTVHNYRATALVLQALSAINSTDENFRRRDALIALTRSIHSIRWDDDYLVEAYYIVPALYGKSLADISSEHCKNSLPLGDSSKVLREAENQQLVVKYSLWIRRTVRVEKTWSLMMRNNSSVYDVIEAVNKLDSTHKAEYNVVGGKPFVSSIAGMRDDTEKGIYWFVYLQEKDSDSEPVLQEKSPADLKLLSDHRIILWYRAADWNDH